VNHFTTCEMPHIRIFRRAELAILPYRWRDRRKGLALGSPGSSRGLIIQMQMLRNFPDWHFSCPFPNQAGILAFFCWVK
jgi:hypothetical protein